MEPSPGSPADPSLNLLSPGPNPCLTPLTLSIGGRIKAEPEDFLVEEIPAYMPSGTGEHLFLWVQKRDASAEYLVGHLARKLGISRDEIGVAGLKDRHAVTRQWVSVPAGTAPLVDTIDDELIQVLRTERHGNKLKTGHLQGNRFEVLVRDVAADALKQAEQIRTLIRSHGVPNYFGEQRFGTDGQTLELGLFLLQGKINARDIPFKRRKFLTRLALSAAQSALFNAVVRKRMEQRTLQQVQPGDVMQVAASGGLFIAEDTMAEQLRCERHEIIITGPLFGPKMKSPLHGAFALEQQVLRTAGLTQDVFRVNKKLTPGGRRPLLLFPQDLRVEPIMDSLRLSFTLPSGSYATVVLREFMKALESPDKSA